MGQDFLGLGHIVEKCRGGKSYLQRTYPGGFLPKHKTYVALKIFKGNDLYFKIYNV